jgi:pimeloyl-ACP methyl ester carboxylesterase
MPSPTLILVHGAWGGAWCWRDLRTIFEHERVASVTLDLPSSRPDCDPTTDLAADAAAVARVAKDIAGPVVLVGHSYGGAVVLEAAPQVADLDQLVFISALAPKKGQSATEASREVRRRTLLDEAMAVDGEFLRLRPDIASRALYNDCDLETSAWAISQLTTQTIASFRSPRTAEDLNTPSRYIMCLNDHAIDPELQSVMAARCDESRTIASDHSPFLSHPQILFEALMK